jgi:four helix bundle protein
MSYNSFEDMSVWQKAMDMAVEVFKLPEGLPRKEDFVLTSKIRRAPLSVPGNLSEVFGRKHTKDKVNFNYDSRDSLAEPQSHLI